jgi:hypothetical protein
MPRIMATVTTPASRPVRWRRSLRFACFWGALALASAAAAHELAGPEALVALAVIPALLAVVETVRALGARTSGMLAERVAQQLRATLGADYVVLTEYSPRDSGAVVPVVVMGPAGVFVVEPRDDDARFGCYRDGWHVVEQGGLRHLADSPSRRAREDASRVRTDISGGGHIRTRVDAFVLLTRGRGDDCASATVPVVCGIAALGRELQARAPRAEASPTHTRAVADALIHPLRVVAG